MIVMIIMTIMIIMITLPKYPTSPFLNNLETDSGEHSLLHYLG